MERSWLAGARWSECDLGSFCCVIPSFGPLLQRPALLWGHIAARRRSAALSVIYVGASSHVGPGGGRAPGRPRRPRVDLRGPREGVRALRRFAPKRKIHPATGAAAPAGGPPLMAAAPASPPGPTGSLAACETPEVDRGGQKCSKNAAKRSENTAKYSKNAAK